MQYNAEEVIRKRTQLEHILKKENIDICCIQEIQNLFLPAH